MVLKKAVKKAVKWVVQKAKAVARFIIRIVVTAVGFVGGIFTIFLPKKLRLQIFILSADGINGLVTKKDRIPSIEYHDES